MERLQDWLDYLERIHPQAMDLGLERVASVWSALGHAKLAPRVVTVAGTNGKGSTITALDALLRACGWRTGATLSPHLLRFNERILLSGEPVADSEIVGAFERIEQARHEITLTYFEFAILAAMDIMARAEVDVALLEVGLGGRLDAVNVIDCDVAVVTSVALDHEAWLGSDREAIGREKAGIMRVSTPVVIGEAAPPASVLAAAQALQAPVHCLGHDFFLEPQDDGVGYRSASGWTLSHLPQPALHLSAIACALQVLELLGEQPPEALVGATLNSLSLAGRLQRLEHAGVLITLDVAHNPHAVAGLLSRLPGRAYQIVFGCLADKQVEAMVSELQQLQPDWCLVPTPGPRGQDAATLVQRCAPLLNSATGFDSVAAGLQAALQQAKAQSGEVLVLGSFTVVEAALRWLQQEA